MLVLVLVLVLVLGLLCACVSMLVKSEHKVRDLQQENFEMELRIEDMEDTICPRESHDWVRVRTWSCCPTGTVESYTQMYQYRCSKCYKRIDSMLPFPPRVRDR